MRSSVAVVAAALVMLGSLATAGTSDRAKDRAAITREFDRIDAIADHAWETRNASLMFAEASDTSVVRTPDGRAIGRTDMIADLQRRMNLTTRIDTMDVVIDSITFVGRDTAVVLSSQRFVRWMKLPDQPERQRISSVQHRQRYARSRGKWRTASAVQELNPTARWADESPAPAPR